MPEFPHPMARTPEMVSVNPRGIYLYSSSSNTVSSNTATSNTDGIYLYSSSNNTVSGNTASSNVTGIYLSPASSSNTVIGNTANSNSAIGIYHYSSSNNTVSGNTASSNGTADIYLNTGSNNYSSEIAAYNWIDATDGSIWAPDQGGTDDGSQLVNIGFNFSFFGNTYTQLKISSNGYVVFGSSSATSLSNVAIPNVGQPNNFIAPFWDDLNPGAGGNIYYKTIGTSPNRTFAVQWNGVPFYSAGGSLTFELLLYEQSGEIIFQYNTMTGSYANGSSATWGIENLDGTDGYGSFPVAVISNQLALRIFSLTASNPGSDWYVNDASTAGDSFTTVAGADTAAGNSPAAPFRTIAKALQAAQAGDAIWVDAGTYAETVVIDTDDIALIGKDPNATVIDPPGDSNVSGLYGIHADTQKGVRIINFGITGAYDGIHFENVEQSIIHGNSISSCGNNGIHLSSSSNNTMVHNDVRQNSSYQIYIYGASAADTAQKNNIIAAPANPNGGIYNGSTDSTAKFDFTRNWFGTADSVAIRGRIVQASNGDSIIWQPYRLGEVDMAAGADTAEPASPSGLAADTSTAGQVTLTWVDNSSDESAFRIYRDIVPDTSSKTFLAELPANTISYVDTPVPAGAAYYYSITVLDSHVTGTTSFENEAFYSAFAADTRLPANTLPLWYVNDTSTAEDSFTHAAGSDITGNGAASNPYRTISKALAQAERGDTIYVDAGLYTETVVIDTDHISLIGRDSNATVIDPPGDSNVYGLSGIYATNRLNLLIKNLGVTGAADGIHFNNVDLSTITGNTAGSNSNGIYLYSSSNNTVSNNITDSNAWSGTLLGRSSINTLSNNRSNLNSYGIVLDANSDSNTLIGNAAGSNSQYGIVLDASSNNVIVQNDVRLNTQYQIYITASFSGPSSADTVQKNNIVPSGTNPDSGLHNNTGKTFDFSRNYWGTTDEQRIAKMIFDTGSIANIMFTPYRLGEVDMAAGADTTAPAAPSGVALDTSAPGNITVSWANPAVNEEANGGAAGFAGVRVYRLRNAPDTTHWANALVWTAGASDTMWVDTGVSDSATYYYRLTSRDAAPFVNESFFSDTKFSVPLPPAAPGPASIRIVGGHHGLGGSGDALAIEFLVLDTGSSAVSSETVTFQITYPSGGGGAALQLGETGGVTGADGGITETITLPSTGDIFQIRAWPAGNSAASAVATVYLDGRDIADSTWRMMAPNKSLLTADPAAVVGADLGSASQYRLYEWREDKGVNPSITFASTQYHAVSAIERGRGFWAKHLTGSTQRWVIDEGSQGVAGFDTVRVALNATGSGWNQIGSGQYFYVDWRTSVKVDTGLPGDTWAGSNLSNLLSVDSAHAAGVLSNVLYWFDGTQYQWGPSAVSDSAVQMKPMTGFWVKALASCTLWVFPNPAEVMETETVVLNQSGMLSAYYKEQNKAGVENDWAIQMMASGGGARDEQNYVGVRPTAQEAALAVAYEPPPAAGGYVYLAMRQLRGTPHPASPPRGEENPWLAAAFAEPGAMGRSWEVSVASDVSAPVTISWDNIPNLPHVYEAYLIGGPQGPVNLRQSASLVLESKIENPKSPISLTLAIGLPEYLAAFLSASLSKEHTFVYPNPGPDGSTGSMTFKYNLQSPAGVTLKIYDVGGRLVRELAGSGMGGSNTIPWDTANKHGQNVGSGVYLYILQSGGNKLVDKLAVVR